MGCPALWQFLKTAGAVKEIKGANQRQYQLIVELIEGKLFAVDSAIWTKEMESIGALRASVKSPAAAQFIGLFSKICNMLRLGCTPVLVLEGKAEQAKNETYMSRYNHTCHSKSGGNRHFLLKQLIQALGLSYVQAPGEGEAMCAALDKINLVDGCITRDADALAFGAKTVLKEFSLSFHTIRENQIQLCSMDEVRKLLDITSGGDQAMQLMIVMLGGDYNQGGIEGVGNVTAFSAIKSLLKNKTSDIDLVEDFMDSVIGGKIQDKSFSCSPAPPPQRSCSGCKRCGCYKPQRKRGIKAHGKSGCEGCGTQSKALGGNGEGGCVPMQEGQICKCPLCNWKHSHGGQTENLHKVLAKERRQSLQHSRLQNAHAGFKRQESEAVLHAAQIYTRNTLGWQERPRFEELVVLCEKYMNLEEEKCREKILPLLCLWDLMHKTDPNIEFRPVKVLKPNIKGKNLGNPSTELYVQFERLEGINAKYEEIDKTCLQLANKNGKQSIPRSILEVHCAALLSEFRHRKKKRKKEKEYKGPKITDFFPIEHKQLTLSPEGPIIQNNNSEVDDAISEISSKVDDVHLTPVKEEDALSNKRCEISQMDIRDYCSSVTVKTESCLMSATPCSSRFGGTSRKLSFFSLDGDESWLKAENQSNKKKKVSAQLDQETIDLCSPTKGEHHSVSDHSIIDLFETTETSPARSPRNSTYH